MLSPYFRFACVAVLSCGFAGCSSTTYSASELPSRYAARPVRDYSFLELTGLTNAPPDEDIILPGDRLQVRLDPGTLEFESEHNWTVSVGASGDAAIPNIGSVRLAGLTQSEAGNTIKNASLQRDVFLTPTVDVALADRIERTILVTGAVGNPGPIVVHTDEVALADAIVRAGGMTNKASGKISVGAAREDGTLQNSEPGAIPVSSSSSRSVQALTISLDSTPKEKLGEVMVQAGAVVHVEPIKPRPIKVDGVISSQEIEVPPGQDVRVLDALALAGGPTYSNWISDKITIVRRDPDSGRTIRIGASVRRARRDRAENILLAPNDIVTVEENIVTFTLSTLSALLGAGVNASQIAI